MISEKDYAFFFALIEETAAFAYEQGIGDSKAKKPERAPKDFLLSPKHKLTIKTNHIKLTTKRSH